jgi:hypothetical protein
MLKDNLFFVEGSKLLMPYNFIELPQENPNLWGWR